MFMYIIHDLEKDDITHPKQYFENSQVYLKKSLNLFQSIGLSVPEENMIHALKYNKFESKRLRFKIRGASARGGRTSGYLMFQNDFLEFLKKTQNLCFFTFWVSILYLRRQEFHINFHMHHIMRSPYKSRHCI